MIARSKCEKILTGHFQVYLQYSIHLFTFIQKQLDNLKSSILIVFIGLVVLKSNMEVIFDNSRLSGVIWISRFACEDRYLK